MENEIRKIPQFEEISLVQTLVQRKSEFLPNIKKVFEEVHTRLSNRIPTLFPNYTLHDVDHCIRIMGYMSEIIDDLDKLNDFEITLMICAALLHDIGMAVDSDTVEKIKKDELELSEIKYKILLERFNNDHTITVQEIIRRIHADLSAEYVFKDFRKYLTFDQIDSIDFTEDLALLCKSHTKSNTWLNQYLNERNEKAQYEYNLKYSAIVLRVSDILDIDGRRTPQILYHLINPKGISNDEWKQHFIISNINKIKIDRQTGQRKVVFYGSCSDVNLHRKILQYLQWINNELRFAIDSTAKMEDKYKLYLKDKVEDNIESKGYTISNYKLSIDFLAITNLLMGEKIYEEKILGLRELIQNSIDACKVQNEIKINKNIVGEEEYRPKIKVIINHTSKKIIIKDNGIGMTEEMIKNYFLNIGRSYYQSDDYVLYGYNYTPIGNFGIGFLACFMLSDKVEVFTRHFKSKYKYHLQLEKNSEYISFSSIEDPEYFGTEIHLDYNQVMKIIKKEEIKLDAFLSSYFLTDVVNLQYINTLSNQDIQIVNSLTPPISQSKNEHVIDLSKYLVGTEGYVVLKNKHHFVKKLEDLSYHNYPALYYNNDKLEQVEDIELKNLYANYKISYLQLPIYDYYKDEFEKAMEVLEDVDEAMDKIEPDEGYSLFLNYEWQNHLINKETNNDPHFEIVDNLYLEDILELNFDNPICPKIQLVEEDVIGNNALDMFLPYDKTVRYYRDGRFDYSLYIRDILIRDYNFYRTNLADNIAISKLKINIMNDSIIPTLSRNDLSQVDQNELNYVIMKAIHLGALENFKLEDEQHLLLEKFINEFYQKSSRLLKE